MFFERGMRRGISYISKRYSQANNDVVGFDNKKTINYIGYFDMNNLYGCAMRQFLPVGKLKWVKNIDNIDLMNIKDDSSVSYIFEVDLEYPKESHDLHNDYPLPPEKVLIDKNMLSSYSLKIANKYNMKTGLVRKFVPNLMDKKNYIAHYKNLQLYLSHGLKFRKNHRVLKFKQSDWMKIYVDFITQKRTCAKNNFEKDFFKRKNYEKFEKKEKSKSCKR